MKKFDIFKDIANNCYQIRTKGTPFILEFDNKEDIVLFDKFIEYYDNSLSVSEIKENLLAKFDAKKVGDLFDILIDNEILLKEEININILNDNKTLIVGNSIFSNELKKALNITSNTCEAELIDYSDFSSLEEFHKLSESFQFIVVDGSLWSPYHIDIINRHCLTIDIPWLFVNGVEDLKFKFGPMFHGKETPCYNCFISRVKSNHEYPQYLESYELHLINNKKISEKDTDEFYVNINLYQMVSNLIALEIIKFFSQWAVPESLNYMICFNMQNYEFEKHRLLKLPYCEVCKPSLEYNSSPWLEFIAKNNNKNA